ncbi:glycosyltransferase [Kushneria sp. EE4]
MILLTAGAQLPFERMGVLALRCAEALPDESVLYQAGPGGNGFFDEKKLPGNLRVEEFIEPEQYQRTVRDARCVITHAGMGNLLYLLEQDVPFLVLPRLVQYGEHRNDHQLDTARAMQKRLNIEFYFESDSLFEQLLTQPQWTTGSRQHRADMIKRRQAFAAELQNVLLTLIR